MNSTQDRRITRELTTTRENVIKLCEAITETMRTEYGPLLMQAATWGDVGVLQHVEYVLRDIANFLNITGEYADQERGRDHA